MTTDTIPAAGTGLPTLTRRAALAGLALGASSIASGVALATTTTPTGDERLTALAAEFKAIVAKRELRRPAVDEAHHLFVNAVREYAAEHGEPAANDVLGTLYDQFHPRDLVGEYSTLGDRLVELSDEIRALPAVGLAGLAAKAVALKWDAGSPKIWNDTIPEEEHDFTDEALRAFARMLDEMARASHA